MLALSSKYSLNYFTTNTFKGVLEGCSIRGQSIICTFPCFICFFLEFHGQYLILFTKTVLNWVYDTVLMKDCVCCWCFLSFRPSADDPECGGCSVGHFCHCAGSGLCGDQVSASVLCFVPSNFMICSLDFKCFIYYFSKDNIDANVVSY